ncbi:MAG TPA: MBL fold metallo-hydrolase [Thermoanaerobaculia bacterium]|nr:MBL fold metallo-hydrolase [Thermoanaerobaculia bacterium]
MRLFRRASLVSLQFSALLAARVSAAPVDGVPIQTVPIADGVYQFITAPDGYVPNGNAVAIVNDADVLVFDTFTRPSTARKLVAEIRRITDKPVRWVVNSHWHPDHWSGNEVFAKEFPGVAIVASDETLEWMRNTANVWPALLTTNLKKSEEAFEKERSSRKTDDGKPVTDEQLKKDEDELRLEREFVAESLTVRRTFPTNTYHDSLTLRSGARELRLTSVVGDSRGTTVLYLPKEKILVTGDVVSYPVPYFTPPLSQHAKTLRTLAALDLDVIIPGHGPAWRDRGFMNLEAELFESIVRQVTDAAQKGLVTEDEIKKVVDVEPFRPRFSHGDPELDAKFRRYASRMIENACREARDGKIWTGN